MKKFLYEWEEIAKTPHPFAYAIRAKYTGYAAFIALSSDSDLYRPPTWNGYIRSVDWGLVTVPTFSAIAINECLLCAEIMLALKWDFQGWTAVKEVTRDENKLYLTLEEMNKPSKRFLSYIYKSYLEANRDTQLREYLLNYITG